MLKETTMKDMLLAMYKHDFNDLQSSNAPDSKQYSLEEKAFLKLMNKHCALKDGHYVLPLPFRNPDIEMPNNRYQAVQRSISLKSKLEKNPQMLKDYKDFMVELFEKGHAVQVVKEDLHTHDGKVWSTPWCLSPRKPGKIRVVFDCSAKYKDVALNTVLLQGPDLTSQLVGVLTRFRENKVAIIGDIEKMFYQVKVIPEHQNYLRFLWWPDGDFTQELAEFKMTVHLFGAVSSPSCANFALRRTAEQSGLVYDRNVPSTLLNNFYVDDMLKSSAEDNAALQMMKDIKELCNCGGFNLTKLGSNSRHVIASIPEDRTKGIKDLQDSSSLLPIERVLCVSWRIENDVFNFRIVLQDVPLTRGGILSSISSIYDPLGFAAPVLCYCLQRNCYKGLQWIRKVGDVVVIKEDEIRNNWKIGRIVEVHPSDDGDVRSYTIRTSCLQSLLCPITKIVLLVESSNQQLDGNV